MVSQRLERLLESVIQAKKILILPHNDPDPDAIVSAVALRYLLAQKLGIHGQIVYRGIIGRAENRALVRYLNYPLRPLKTSDLDQATHVALVDTQPSAGNNAWPASFRATIVIDHHPSRQRVANVSFADIRPEIGATSTIMTQYLRAAGLDLPSSLATALFYGIKTDTKGLSRSTDPADAAAYLYLQPRLEVESLAEIERAQVPAAYFKSFVDTLAATRVYGKTAISYVGSMEYPDMAAEMADLLARLEEIEWVICTGVYQMTLLLAVRAPGRRGDAGLLAQAIVGTEGAAGGHNSMAGGQIPLKSNDLTRILAQIRQRTLNHLSIGSNTVSQSLI